MADFPDIKVVDVSGPFPGGWVDSKDFSGKVWSGESYWLTQHGSATVQWLLGKPHAAFGVITQDGQVIERCETFSPLEKEYWRRPNPDGVGYVTGVLDITVDGVTFRDQPMPVRSREGDELDSAMSAHPDAARLFRDDRFAGALNQYFRNEGFRRDGTDYPAWSISFRTIGGMIADIRAQGESYLDFYLGDHEFSEGDTARVEAFLAGLGWHRLTVEEVALDHSKALAILDACEAREEGGVAQQDRPDVSLNANTREWGRNPSDRMHAATNAGKVTSDERESFFKLYDVYADVEPDQGLKP